MMAGPGPARVTDTSADVSGFAHGEGGKVRPATPRDGDIVDRVGSLRELMGRGSEAPWKAVLIQLKKSENVRVAFEYEDGRRWKVTPDNLVAMREALRPEWPARTRAFPPAPS